MNVPGRFFLMVLAACFGLATGILFASDPPDSLVNPASGLIEIVDPVWSGTNFDIRHVIVTQGHRARDLFSVSTHPQDDRGPRLAIAPTGTTWIVWWRDGSTDRVLARKRYLVQGSGSWSGERALSLDGESSSNPAIVYDGNNAVVVFEIEAGADTAIAVNTINDEPDPIPTRSIIAVTHHTGDRESTIESESGSLWITWVDGALALGFSQYDHASGVWSAPAYESYADGDIAAARERVRQIVLGP